MSLAEDMRICNGPDQARNNLGIIWVHTCITDMAIVTQRFGPTLPSFLLKQNWMCAVSSDIWQVFFFNFLCAWVFFSCVYFVLVACICFCKRCVRGRERCRVRAEYLVPQAQ
jgi:hypothetical protein